jgi:heme oxygenase (mycobilin-producing)
VISVSIFQPSTVDGPFVERMRAVLDVLAGRPGFLGGTAGQALDDPGRWVLVTEWQDVGSYRRALGNSAVKLQATPVLAAARDEPSAYEQLVRAEPGGTAVIQPSDLAEQP